MSRGKIYALKEKFGIINGRKRGDSTILFRGFGSLGNVRVIVSCGS
jgi:hypothetical protein